MDDIAEEQAILVRLARAHKDWRDRRPPSPPPMTDAELRAAIIEVSRRVKNPEPQDVEVIREAESDPLKAAIRSQLSVVGWRLYAKGGVDLLVTVYRRIEVEQHPGFVFAVLTAWRDLGFPGDPRGVWRGIELL
jgi:hypothetical protein